MPAKFGGGDVKSRRDRYTSCKLSRDKHTTYTLELWHLLTPKGLCVNVPLSHLFQYSNRDPSIDRYRFWPK